MTQCLCKNLGPTTVVADVDSLFTNSNIGEIFSAGGLSAFENFPFYRSYIFYIFLGSTIFVILSSIYGYRIDKKKNSKV
jgi:hypothetical protein